MRHSNPSMAVMFLMAALAVAVICISAATGYAAPLEPVQTRIDTHVWGMAEINTQDGQRFGDYDIQGGSRSFTGSGTDVASSVTVGGTPGFEHVAASSSSGGVSFEQVAINEYLITLTSVAAIEAERLVSPAMIEARAEAHNVVHLEADFMIHGYPGQSLGEASTIYLELAHLGTMGYGNRGHARSDASVQVATSGPGAPFEYASQLETPPLFNSEFQQTSFSGTRDATRDGVIETLTGEMIHLSMDVSSEVFGMLAERDGFDDIAAESDFAAGLQLHMTVMPEPASAVLLGLCSVPVLLRRRRRAL